jgi:hypothetical protein
MKIQNFQHFWSCIEVPGFEINVLCLVLAKVLLAVFVLEQSVCVSIVMLLVKVLCFLYVSCNSAVFPTQHFLQCAVFPAVYFL